MLLPKRRDIINLKDKIIALPPNFSFIIALPREYNTWTRNRKLLEI